MLAVAPLAAQEPSVKNKKIESKTRVYYKKQKKGKEGPPQKVVHHQNPKGIKKVKKGKDS